MLHSAGPHLSAMPLFALVAPEHASTISASAIDLRPDQSWMGHLRTHTMFAASAHQQRLTTGAVRVANWIDRPSFRCDI